MAERRKGRKKKDDDIKNDEDKPSKVEYAVSKYLRSKLPEKKTTLLSHKVSYFVSSKAIDCLLDSPWASGKEKGPELLFTSRESVVRFMDTMLRHKFFHRAKKIVVQKEKKKRKDKDDENQEESSIVTTKDSKSDIKESKKSEETKESAKKLKKSKDNKDKEEKSDKEKDKKEGEEGEKKKEKKKFKLDMHLDQLFVDGNEVYVWIYDPIPVRAWIIGTLLVVGAVLVCLFPLWPKTVRHYVYYLSVAAAGFLVFIIGLAVIRLVVFVLVWLVSFGKHHLWLLPNLTEDVGFFESFWPLYKYEFKGGDEKEDDNKKEDEELEAKEASAGKGDQDGGDTKTEVKNGGEESDRESQGSGGSSKDEFELLEADEITTAEKGEEIGGQS